MTTAYEKVFTAAKTAARDEIRVAMTARRVNNRRKHEIRINLLNKDIEAVKATIAAAEQSAVEAEFDAAHAAEIHNPKAAKLAEKATKARENAAKTAEYEAKTITRLEESIASEKKEIDEINADLEKVANGEQKVNYDEMSARAVELAQARYADKFAEGEYDNLPENETNTAEETNS